MKKRKTLFMSILTIALVLTLGGCKMTERKYETQEEQIEFLKKHEKQMTEYVKTYNSKIETVEYEWSTTDSGVVGNGLPQGGGTVIKVHGFVNDNPKLRFYLAVDSRLESVTTFEPERDICFLTPGVDYLERED